jgi:hypothetical protein
MPFLFASIGAIFLCAVRWAMSPNRTGGSRTPSSATATKLAVSGVCPGPQDDRPLGVSNRVTISSGAPPAGRAPAAVRLPRARSGKSPEESFHYS